MKKQQHYMLTIRAWWMICGFAIGVGVSNLGDALCVFLIERSEIFHPMTVMGCLQIGALFIVIGGICIFAGSTIERMVKREAGITSENEDHEHQ